MFGRNCPVPSPVTEHVAQFFEAIGRISREIDTAAIDRLAHELAALRERHGRLFLLGVGGSAGNCSHAVNDFRKLCAVEARQQQEQQSHRTREATKQRLLREYPREAVRQQTIDELRTQALTIESRIRLTEIRLARENRTLGEGLSRLEETYRSRRAALESEFEPARGKYESELRRLCKELAVLDAKRGDLENNQNSRSDRQCGGSGDREVSSTALGVVDQDPVQIPRPVPRMRWPQLIRFYHRSFGRLPATTRWHPYHTTLRPVLAALRTASETAELLVVSSGGPFGALLSREFPGRDLAVTQGMLASELYRQVSCSAAKFDLRLCDLAVDDLVNFRDLLGKVRPFMKDHGRIIVFHDNLAGRSLDEQTFEFTRGLFPLIGRSRISFTGSYIGALIIRGFASRLTRHNLARLESNIAFAATLALCAPLARFASRIEERQNPRRFPAHCTSMNNRDRPPLTSSTLHHLRMRSVCAGSAVF